MIIPEVAPMLTCTAVPDGFMYELTLRAPEGRPAITQVRVGPYFFRPDHTPRILPLGLTMGGPDNGFWMHRRTPTGFGRWHWEVAVNEEDAPTYLVTRGTLSPGTRGLFQFVSLIAPGGMRAGLEVWRGDAHDDCGVTGPNYERFLRGDHEH